MRSESCVIISKLFFRQQDFNRSIWYSRRKWSQTVANGHRQSQTVTNGHNWLQTVANGHKWSQTILDNRIRLQKVAKGCKR